MSKVALIIGANDEGRLALSLPEARRRALRQADLWALPAEIAAEAAPANVFGLDVRPIGSARQCLRYAQAAGLTHLVLFGTRLREAFELALLVRLQVNEPRTVGSLTIIAAHQRASRLDAGCRGARQGQPLCFAYALDDRLSLAA